MKNLIIITVALLFLFVTIGMIASENNSKGYYVCNCKDDCKCNSVFKNPGKCTCGSNLVGMHVLAIEKGVGIFCRCGADCTCERNKSDLNKCSCGKSVKRVSLKGKYVCTCGSSCNCGTISDKPGKCHCGMELKQVS
jgi:hypothetical protein